MAWADLGGQHFGDQDVTKALRMGVDPMKILKAVNLSGGSKGGLADRLGSDWSGAQQGTLGSSLGGSGKADTRMRVGHADIALYNLANPLTEELTIGKRAQNIRDQWTGDRVNPEARADPSSGIGKLWSQIQNQARAQDESDAAAERDAALAEEEEARADRIRTTQTTRVGRSAMSVRGAQSAARRSGRSSTGTAQFGRSARGSNVQTLNIA